MNELAREAGVSGGMISRIERGGRSTGKRRRGVGDETLRKLVVALQVRIEWLMTGEGPFDVERDPLPRRSQAIQMAREGGVSEAVLEAVTRLVVPDAEEKTAWWWAQAILRREALLKEEGGLPPSSKAPPSLPPASSHRRPLLVKPSS